MTTSDKPKVHATLASLDVEADPEPFVWGTKSGKRVTFPDPGAMDAFEVEDFLADFTELGRNNTVVMKKWLSEKDFEALREDRLTLRQFTALMKAVLAHYSDIFGPVPGEGLGSTTS